MRRAHRLLTVSLLISSTAIVTAAETGATAAQAGAMATHAESTATQAGVTATHAESTATQAGVTAAQAGSTAAQAGVTATHAGATATQAGPAQSPIAGGGAPPGSVISSSVAALPKELAGAATGRFVKYVTTDVRGERITATGLVLTPRTNRKDNVVVWAHGTTGLADRCAPSTHQDVFWPEARAAVAELLSRGWTVAAPDYPGLGTPQPHPYLIGASEGRSIIDSVRAARRLNPSLSAKYAIDGHSQGGQGALFANQLAPSYDGDLQLRGTAGIAPVSNVDVLAPQIPGTPGQGYLVMGVYGLSAVEPSFRPADVLAAPARQRAGVLETGCLTEILAAYAPLTATQLLNGGQLPDAWVAKLAHYDNPAQTAPSAPILIVQGTADEAVPAAVTDILVDQLDDYRPVRYDKLPGQTHDGAVFASTETVADWIADRLR
ncbi:alpha/beta fold hydrolase [Paractinoplanes atraurantiacus]|uniref:Secretory lipase n=1 Tax=Paractinoplanes atraurantiacus TaxID=1036182 RepID=A0A285KKD8_9ACTN|nr:alpha/beta fold hydrolase [Actinoplanes atraurantiacus]SNY73112.1 Secretory lipase [Actinoplanes atraurantiacus]